MNYVREPDLGSKCDMCGCKFGSHFASFDGTQTGCLTDLGQRDGRCTCKGFAFVYRPKVRMTTAQQQALLAEQYYNK